MSKKNFKDDNPAMAFISGERGTPRTQEVHGTQEVRPTQGRKGMKQARINMAFTQDNLEYLRIMSRIEGVSMTDYVNRLLETDRQERSAILAKAKRVLKGAE